MLAALCKMNWSTVYYPKIETIFDANAAANRNSEENNK